MTPVSEPIQFGRDGALMGMYHASAAPVGLGVLLCPPLGQMLVRTHRVYRQLANHLAARGVCALRFDYRGSGDSAGDSVALDWRHCLDDVRSAAAELRTRAGCFAVAGFGARLGGSLALAATKEADLAQLVLWDPVLDGARHVAELDAMQEALRTDPLHYARPRTPAEVAGQWLGFPVNPHWRTQLLAWQASPVPVPIVVVDSLAPGANGVQVPPAGARVVPMQPATPWDELNRLEHAILAPDLLRVVGEALGLPA